MSKRDGSSFSVLKSIEEDPSHHLAGQFRPPTPFSADSSLNGSPSPSPRPGSPRSFEPSLRRSRIPRFSSQSQGLWTDLTTMRWMRVPASSFQMLLYPALFYLNYYLLQVWNLVPRHWYNPFEPLLFISHAIPDSPPGDPRYRKGYLDLVFLLYYVIFWSFVRQSLTLYVLHPLARHMGIRKTAKLDRFGEQGYAVLYFSFTTTMGLVVMSKLPTWWYKTEHFWIDYPHWQMTPLMKTYYLLQSAYWTQQLLVLALKLEKPRKDINELVIHHIVTLWLIGWSYLINLSRIGNAVFISMDIPDIFIAVSKIFNYLRFEKTKTVAFAWFMILWTYFRHWLNLVILWSVWTEFDLIPEHTKVWNPSEGVWFPYWMKYQVFAPLVALQLVNLFWYVLIWRVLWRAVFSSTLDDVRSDDEEDGDPRKSNGAANPTRSYPNSIRDDKVE